MRKILIVLIIEIWILQEKGKRVYKIMLGKGKKNLIGFSRANKEETRYLYSGIL